MANERIENLGFLFVSTLLAASGQLLFKYGLNSTAAISTLVFWVGIGLAAYVLSTLIYLFVLSRVHLSWAYGIGGLSYIFAVVFANFVLMENVPVVRWIGVGIIFVGVALIGLS